MRQLPPCRFALSLLLIFLSVRRQRLRYPAAGVTVIVDPLNVTVPVGSSRQMTAKVSGATNTSVTWSVNGVTGGNSTIGSISSAGLYVAPAAPPAGWYVTVKAVKRG